MSASTRSAYASAPKRFAALRAAGLMAWRRAGLPPIPFALGFSVFVISIVLLGLSNLARQEA